MKHGPKKISTLILAVTCMAMVPQAGMSVFAQSSTGATTVHRKTARRKSTSIEQQMREMREQFQQQQDEIDQLKQQLQSRDQQLQQAQDTAQQAQQAAQQAQSQVQAAQQSSSSSTAAYTDLHQAVQNVQAQTEQANQAVSKVEQDQKKLNSDVKSLTLANGKVKIGGLFYGDYAYYTATGFGPQFLTQLNQEGPGNDGFNSFDITRTYLNVLFTPVNAITLRITPNIYRMVDGGSTGIADGNGAQIGSSTNGNLGLRLKYAYVQFNHPFSGAFAKGNIRLGQTMNPLVDWEEGLYGYRFVNLTPWNYLSLSSTYVGAEVNGPIMSNGKEYLDYQIGAFNTASFHSIEQSDKKQAMGRLTWYPFGTKVDRTGFGLTVFENYGYNTKTPDTKSTPLNRLAVLGHYQSTKKGYEIVGEYDLGRNAISTGNLFSGAGPTSTGTYAAFSSLASALVAGDKTRQQGYAVFGHAQLGSSRFAVFGMLHGFQPNTKISGSDPLDFRRTVGGISYAYNKYLTFALDDQNLTYTHSQFTMSAAQIATFSPALAVTYPNGIPNAVPLNTNAIFTNVQFNY